MAEGKIATAARGGADRLDFAKRHVLADGAQATSAKPVMVKRCGYTNATSGRSALYPWHMSCVAARKVVTGSGNHHAQVIDFGPGWDGGAVRINGRYWVCTGQMGYYNCGYPYRPQKVKGSRVTKGHLLRTSSIRRARCSPRAPVVPRRSSSLSPGADDRTRPA